MGRRAPKKGHNGPVCIQKRLAPPAALSRWNIIVDNLKLYQTGKKKKNSAVIHNLKKNFDLQPGTQILEEVYVGSQRQFLKYFKKKNNIYHLKQLH